MKLFTVKIQITTTPYMWKCELIVSNAYGIANGKNQLSKKEQ
jgi:hypothetical protein